MTNTIFPALSALLQAPAPTPGGGSMLPQLLFQFGLIFAIFYFLMIRPQQKQRKNHEKALKSIKRGDRIVTSGGIIGDVIHVKDSVVDGKPSPLMEDEVTIKSGETRLILERGRIAKITSAAAAATT
ncbi:MAG: preprotein translocase subunit YajC [Gemmatimonadota bacterium]